MYSVLIVEDDPMISEIYHKKFTTADFSVDVATTLAEARKQTEQNIYDILLLDLVLPDGDGVDLIKSFKQAYPTSSTTIAVLSNLSDYETQQNATAAGADLFFVKYKYIPSDLVKIVSDFLATKKTETV